MLASFWLSSAGLTSLSLLVACTPQVDTPANWQAALTPLARTKISAADTRHDTLTINWIDSNYDEIFARPVALHTLLAGFSQRPQVQSDSFAGLPCLRLRTPTSTLYWTPADSTVIKALIQSEGLAELRQVQIGLNRKNFFKRYLTSYPDYLDAINVVEFYSGMADNTVYFTFKDNRLARIDLLHVPD